MVKGGENHDRNVSGALWCRVVNVEVPFDRGESGRFMEDVAEEMMKEWIHHLRPLKRTRTWLSRTRSSLPHLPLAASPLLLLADCRRRAIFRCTLFHVFPHTDGRGSSAALGLLWVTVAIRAVFSTVVIDADHQLCAHTHTQAYTVMLYIIDSHEEFSNSCTKTPIDGLCHWSSLGNVTWEQEADSSVKWKKWKLIWSSVKGLQRFVYL